GHVERPAKVNVANGVLARGSVVVDDPVLDIRGVARVLSPTHIPTVEHGEPTGKRYSRTTDRVPSGRVVAPWRSLLGREVGCAARAPSGICSRGGWRSRAVRQPNLDRVRFEVVNAFHDIDEEL